MNTKNITRIILFALVLGLGSAVFYVKRIKEQNRGEEISSPNTASSTENANLVSVPGIDYGFEDTTSSSSPSTTRNIPAPSLSRPIIIPKGFSPEDALLAKKDLEIAIDLLKNDPEKAKLWADLGQRRKGIEDYEGARDAYAYALALAPKYILAADSLGVLYASYLKDYQKAEQYFLLAIELDSTAHYEYLRLYELYHDIMKDNARARAILEKGLKAIPGEESFRVLLESLK